MLAMDSVLFYPSVDSTFMFEFVGKIYAYNKFHVRNTYKIKQIDSNNFKLINLTTEERLKRDSINHTDSYGIRQGKWITSHHHENNYVNGKLHGQQLEFYSNGDIRYKDNYTNGTKEGYNFSYYKGKKEPFTVSYYENDNNLWMGFVEANKQFIYPLKDFHINTDSIYVVAPYNNGNTWYEGAFLNPEQKEITGKRVGIHKVYFTNGKHKAILDFDKKRITEYDSTGKILRNNDTFENGTRFPTNYKK